MDSMTKSRKATNRVFLVILIVLAIVSLFPVIWVALSSFKPQNELFSSPMTFFPKTWTLGNYISAISQGNFARYFMNTVFVACVSTVLTVLINIMAGYALAKYYFRGRNLIFGLMIATLMVPLQVIMIPIFLQLKNLGMLNSLWGIIIPPAATPTGIFLARQYMVNLSNSMIESARIDGAKELRIFVRIILPLSQPIIATITIFSFMWRWNDYILPLLVLSDQKNYTIQIAIKNFIGMNGTDWSSILSASVISMIPVTIIFVILQRYIIGGISAGGVKG